MPQDNTMFPHAGATPGQELFIRDAFFLNYHINHDKWDLARNFDIIDNHARGVDRFYNKDSLRTQIVCHICGHPPFVGHFKGKMKDPPSTCLGGRIGLSCRPRLLVLPD